MEEYSEEISEGNYFGEAGVTGNIRRAMTDQNPLAAAWKLIDADEKLFPGRYPVAP